MHGVGPSTELAQRAVIVEDDIARLDQPIMRPREAVERRAVAEALSEHEVDVSVFRVAEDDAVAVVVPIEQDIQCLTGRQDFGDRHDDVVEQSGRPGGHASAIIA